MEALLTHIEIEKNVLEDPNKRCCKRFDSSVVSLVRRVFNEVHSTDRTTQKILTRNNGVLEIAKACFEKFPHPYVLDSLLVILFGVSLHVATDIAPVNRMEVLAFRWKKLLPL